MQFLSNKGPLLNVHRSQHYDTSFWGGKKAFIILGLTFEETRAATQICLFHPGIQMDFKG